MSKKRKGIILAGGYGTRLYPVTQVVSKQLLPVYDKPMIYYPLSILMMAGIQDILIISTPEDMPRFQALLQNGQQWGLHFQYAVQPYPAGIAQAFLIAQSFIDNHPSALILGDNIFYGHHLQAQLQEASERKKGATIFAYHVQTPERYGVVTFNKKGQAIDIIEKPLHPPSQYAVTGLYFYDTLVTELAKTLLPSSRGELEITDLNRLYLAQNQLHVTIMGRGYAWLDTGTHESLIEASNFIHTLERRQGLKIACPEEIAFRKGWIQPTQLETLAKGLMSSSYGNYLLQLLEKNNLP